MVDPLSRTVQALTDAGIASIEQLETAIAVARGDQAGCTIESLATTMRTSAARVQAVLEPLEALGVIGQNGAQPPRWRIVRTDLLPAIQETSTALANDRRRVVNHFYAHRLEKLRAFSDAFRLRKDT